MDAQSSSSLARIQVDIAPVLQPINGSNSTTRHSPFCGGCWRKTKAWANSATGITFLLLLYLIAGAVVFMLIGSNHEKKLNHRTSRNSDDPLAPYDPDGKLSAKTRATVDRLWSITEDLNILYRDNWTQLASAELRNYQDQLVKTIRKTLIDERYSYRQSWTFPMAFLYSLSLITTIGYGFYFPYSDIMKLVTLLYSLLGIPLFLLFLSVSGDRAALAVGSMSQCLCCCLTRRRRSLSRLDVSLPLQPTLVPHQRVNGHAIQIEMDQPAHSVEGTFEERDIPQNPAQVPLFLLTLLIVLYILLGSVIFVLCEGVSFSDGIYLSVSLLLTLGFATQLPGMNGENGYQKTSSQISLLVMAFYVIVGMSLVAAFFNVLVDFHCALKKKREKDRDRNFMLH